MADDTFERSSAGYTELMKSDGVRSELRAYADGLTAVANAAMHEDRFSPQLERDPYSAFDFTTTERAGVRVQTNNPHARLAEARYGLLQNAAGV